MYADPTSINLTSGILDLLIYLNTVTKGWFLNMTLISIYLVLLSSYYLAKRDLTGGLAISGFATFIIALLFWLSGWLSIYIFLIVIAIAIIGVLALMLDNKF